jgi:hypothetical protein
MMRLRKPTSKVQGILLALAIVLLQGFSASEAKDPAPVRSTPRTAPIPLLVAKPQCSGLTVTGPGTISRYAGYATFYITNHNGGCVTWYYDNTYTTNSGGSLTIFFNQWTTTGQKSITAIQHMNCLPSGTPTACGIVHYTVTEY